MRCKITINICVFKKKKIKGQYFSQTGIRICFWFVLSLSRESQAAVSCCHKVSAALLLQLLSQRELQKVRLHSRRPGGPLFLLEE